MRWQPGATVLDIGSGVTLISNDAGIDMTGAKQKEISGVQGVSLEYRIDLNLDDSGNMSAVVKDVVAVKQSTSVFSTGRMATMGFLNQGTGFALGDGLDRAMEVSSSRGAGFYGAMSAGDFATIRGVQAVLLPAARAFCWGWRQTGRLERS